jgi:hypothetical protein
MDAAGAGDNLEVQPPVLAIHTYHASLANELLPLESLLDGEDVFRFTSSLALHSSCSWEI